MHLPLQRDQIKPIRSRFALVYFLVNISSALQYDKLRG